MAEDGVEKDEVEDEDGKIGFPGGPDQPRFLVIFNHLGFEGRSKQTVPCHGRLENCIPYQKA